MAISTNRWRSLALGILTLTALFSQGYGDDGGRLIRSVVYPGMGQLGDGQIVKGLSFMTVETVFLSLMFAEVTKSQSYARETAYLQVEYDRDTTYELRVSSLASWKDAYTNHGKSLTMAAVYGGLAAVSWGLNIADVLIFVPRETEKQSSVLKNLKDNLAINAEPDKASIVYKLNF